MSRKPTWSDAELVKFDELIDMVSSRQQMVRINGRIEMNNFIKLHGKEKCDAMWERLQKLAKK